MKLIVAFVSGSRVVVVVADVADVAVDVALQGRETWQSRPRWT